MANVNQAPASLALIAPDIQAQQMALQRQQQLAEAIRQQASTPIDPNVVVSGAGPSRVVPISPLQGLTKLAQAVVGGSLQRSNDDQSLALAKQYQGRLADILRGGAPQSPVIAAAQAAQDDGSGAASGVPALSDTPQQSVSGQTPMPQQAAPQASPSAGGMGSQPQAGLPSTSDRFALANLLRGQVIGQVGGDEAAKAYYSDNAPTEYSKTLEQAGIPRGSLLHQQMMQANAAKTNYIADENIRPGGYSKNPVTGQITNFPAVPEGFQAVADGKGGFAIQPVQGATAAMAASEAAKLAGKNQQTLTPIDQLPVDAQGRPLPRTMAASIDAANDQGAAPTQPAHGIPHDGLDISKVSPQNLAYLQKNYPQELAQGIVNYNKSTSGQSADAVPVAGVAAPTGSQGVGLPLGAKANADAAANNKQDLVKSDYKTLSDQNATAQTTISRLQSIKDLSAKAITGGEIERRDFVNSLLSVAGVKGATDAKTASDLLDKNAANIALAVGGGSGATDALRTLAQSAYPGRHMTQGAIDEAVNALVPSMQMTQAKAALLTPHVTSGDAEKYLQTKQVFDANADPRLWQYKNLGPGTPQGKAFLQNILKQEPDFLTKAQALHGIGAY